MEYRVRDFSPGFLDTPEEDMLPGGATPDARNEDFDTFDFRTKRATVKKRGGLMLMNPVAMDAGATVDGLFEFRQLPTTTPVLLAICNGKLKVFDNIDTFTQVGATAPFTPGNTARAEFFANNAFLCDGTAFLRYNGTDLVDVGQVKPTSATNISAVAPVGAGVSGTFEAYYVWYDPIMDHESSPSDTTAATTVLVNQARRHTKPGGAPGSPYTQWRAYVRRTDTNEFNFYRAATVPIASATFDEELTDTTRRNAGAGPYSSANDPPPIGVAILVQWKGFGLATTLNDDSFYMSKQGDLQSWHPAHKFPVARGDGEKITSILPYGTDVLIQKGHSTYHLVGDQLPFVVEPLHSKWGNVSQESGLEVNGFFYGWDRENGPYRTDTGRLWETLVRGRIADVVATVNRSTLGEICAIYDESADVIRWAVALFGNSRKRLVLKYHIGLDCWLPPDDGMEYSAFASFTLPGGTHSEFMGDYWGRVYKLNTTDRDGVPAGLTTIGPIAVTSATADTVTCAGATFYTDGSGLVGLPVAVRSTSGQWQWRRIVSNTATEITLDTTHDNIWTTIPDASYTLIVGGIRWYRWTPWIDFGVADLIKALTYFFLQGKATSSSNDVEVVFRFNDVDAAVTSKTFRFPTGALAGIWGVMIWGVGLWGTTSRRMRKARLSHSPFTVQIQFLNYYPDQPFTMTQYLLQADPLPGRKAAGLSQ